MDKYKKNTNIDGWPVQKDGVTMGKDDILLELNELSNMEAQIKDIATEFFYYWHNSPGTNTADGFDDWWAINKKRLSS